MDEEPSQAKNPLNSLLKSFNRVGQLSERELQFGSLIMLKFSLVDFALNVTASIFGKKSNQNSKQGPPVYVYKFRALFGRIMMDFKYTQKLTFCNVGTLTPSLRN